MSHTSNWKTVKFVTKPSDAVCGYKGRVKYICSRTESQIKIETFVVKVDYKVQTESVEKFILLLPIIIVWYLLKLRS